MSSPNEQRNSEGSDCKVLTAPGSSWKSGERDSPARAGCSGAGALDQKSRLVRSWTHLERQRGGFGFPGGLGEAQIETDALTRSASTASKGPQRRGEDPRAAPRRAQARPYPVVATSPPAGKSTLFNRLTACSARIRC
jgi:GTP-binding protein HflX